MCGMMERKMTVDQCQTEEPALQALDAELQKLIDEELASVEKEVSASHLGPQTGDPDAAVSKHMEVYSGTFEQSLHSYQ